MATIFVQALMSQPTFTSFQGHELDRDGPVPEGHPNIVAFSNFLIRKLFYREYLAMASLRSDGSPLSSLSLSSNPRFQAVVEEVNKVCGTNIIIHDDSTDWKWFKDKISALLRKSRFLITHKKGRGAKQWVWIVLLIFFNCIIFVCWILIYRGLNNNGWYIADDNANAFSWIEIFKFWIKFNWNVLPMV